MRGDGPDAPGFLSCGGLAYRGGSGGRARPLRAGIPPTLVLVTRTRVEVITRVEATLASSSARFEVRKQVTADPVTAPAGDRHRHGPFRRLAGVAVKAAWDHAVPSWPGTAACGTARGIIEPAARRFQHHQLRQDDGVLAHAMVISRAEFGGTPNAHVIREDPLELLMRLRSVTAARYAGDETIREARCCKIAVAVSGTTAIQERPCRRQIGRCDTRSHVVSEFVDWRFGVMPRT